MDTRLHGTKVSSCYLRNCPSVADEATRHVLLECVYQLSRRREMINVTSVVRAHRAQMIKILTTL